MNPILVVYYSRSGTTRRIAQEIARTCDADVEELSDVIGRGGPLGYVRSAIEAMMGFQTTIRPVHHAPGDYELVVIGTPVWFWSVSSPIRSYVLTHRSALRRVAFFCTFGGSGGNKVLGDLQGLCGRPAVATLPLTDGECAAPGHRAKVASFARQLLRGRKAPGGAEPGPRRQARGPAR